MSFWRGETLAEKLPDLVTPFDRSAIDCAAYTLHVGDEIYISPNQMTKNPDRHTKEKLTKGQSFAIPPGQFAFLLTEETITVPDDALALISIKGRTKFRGLVNISGFHVDPGYSGQLLFSVLNAGPKPLHLTQGQELFLIWYANLDGPTAERKNYKGLGGIEPELINGISGEILSLQSLTDKQRALENQLSRQKTRVTTLTTIAVLLLIALVGALVTLTVPAFQTSLESPATNSQNGEASGQVPTAPAPK